MTDLRTVSLLAGMAILLTGIAVLFQRSRGGSGSSGNDQTRKSPGALQWAPPPADSSELIPFLRDTSRPKLAYSTYIGWYEDGGLNETVLFKQVEAMATKLRQHGWTHVLHDYGWQVCGSTFNLTPVSNKTKLGCYHVDAYGRLLPDPQRYPSTAPNGSWKPFIDKVHAQGIAFGLHLIHGIPIIAAQKKLPILGTKYTIDQLVASHGPTFIGDHWPLDASHPGAQAYYDSVVSMWAEQGLDFIYFDGVEGDPTDGGCQIGAISLLADSLRRLGNGMFMYTSFGPPDSNSGCSYEAISELAPYVRVGADTVDAWYGSYEFGFSTYTRLVAPSIRPHHFPDLASLMVGKIHCPLFSPRCKPGPDFYVPSNSSVLKKDEVISYASLVAMLRSTWWPSGALSEMDDFALSLLTNDAVIRITMMSTNTRQVPTSPSTPSQFTGPGVVWAADDSSENWKYVLLVNMCPCSAGLGCIPACGDAHASRAVDVDFLELGLTPSATCELTELWGNKDMGKASGKLHATLRPHASLLVKLSNCLSPEHMPLAWSAQARHDQSPLAVTV